MNKLFRFFLLAAIIPVFIFSRDKQGLQWLRIESSVAYPLLEPGDKIDEMVVATGAEDAVPLWSFCSPAIENDHLITVDCGEVPFRKLAIGHTFDVMDLVPRSSYWSTLTWQLYLDGHPIDLSAFGTHDFIRPDLALNPAPVREIFKVVRVWDVVLVNPKAGAHTLHGEARSEKETYTWVVHFSVEVRSVEHRTNLISLCSRC